MPSSAEKEYRKLKCSKRLRIAVARCQRVRFCRLHILFDDGLALVND